MAIRKDVGKDRWLENPEGIEVSEWNGHHTYMKRSYEGMVVRMFERNDYDDSDFYAVVWDEATGKFLDICYATTRAWTYPNGASIDASPELMEKYNKHGLRA